MLDRLRLTNFALFEEQEIEFGDGFNSLLGETGAGKSIIIDALSFVIGAKSDKIVIRNGAAQTKVEAVFSNISLSAVGFLKNYDIDYDGDLIISRSLNSAGKNDVRINGNYSTLSVLKELGNYLVSIYGQHENIILLNDKNHLSILDSFNAEEIGKYKDCISLSLNKYDALDNKIKELGGDENERAREIDLLDFAINEIEKAHLIEGEDDELSKNIAKSSSFEKIVSSINSVLNLLDNGGAFSVVSNLKQSSKELSSIERYDEKYLSFSDRLSQASIEIDDVIQSLEEEKDNSFFDERQLEAMIEREQLIKKLKRKYGATIGDILEYLQQAKIKKDNYINADYEISQLEKQKQQILQTLKTDCDSLSKLRYEMAQKVEKQIEKELFELGMKNTTLKIHIEPRGEFSRQTVNNAGFDNVKFLFSANLGQDVKSLSKTISGGEMSRFMLAFKTVLKNDEGLLVFDEVDSGISGQIAISVAQKLAKISKLNQILCISHLPQVCSMADKFYKVKKFVKNNNTFSSVNEIEGEEIVKEIAGMGFGENLTGNAYRYARDLIEKNKEYKNSIVE